MLHSGLNCCRQEHQRGVEGETAHFLPKGPAAPPPRVGVHHPKGTGPTRNPPASIPRSRYQPACPG
jgi:hypothetical protein